MPARRRTDALPKRDPVRDAIALRAYELFVKRGREHGHALEDWLRAEQELSYSRPTTDSQAKTTR